MMYVPLPPTGLLATTATYELLEGILVAELFTPKYPCESPLEPAGPGGTDMYDLFDGQLSRYNGYNGPLNTQSASCGDVHFPPNTVGNYDYGNNAVVWSDCSDYNPGNPASELYWEVSDGNWQTIPCDPSLGFNTFDCNQESYLMWWMQNMPGYNNGTLDLYQYSMPSWWQYIVALDTTIRYN